MTTTIERAPDIKSIPVPGRVATTSGATLPFVAARHGESLTVNEKTSRGSRTPSVLAFTSRRFGSMSRQVAGSCSRSEPRRSGPASLPHRHR